MRWARKAAATTGVLLIVALAGGCADPMRSHGRITPFGPSRVFKNGASARPQVPGTVPQAPLEESEAFATGKVRGAFVQTFPIPITSELRESGREHYNTFCAVCHGPTGDGDGIMVKFRFPHPPSYYSAELRKAPVGHFYDVITNGFGVMYGYGDRIPPMDRWAIIAYIRGLQAGRSTGVTDMRPKTASRLRGAQK